MNLHLFTDELKTKYDINAIHCQIEEDYAFSQESMYWKERLSMSYGKCAQRGRSKEKQRKKHKCLNMFAYKRPAKWYGYDGEYMDEKALDYVESGMTRGYAKNNRVYCPCCYGSKVLFESEKKANDFIRYNKDLIAEQNGYAPVRSYYCEVCGGWHVTSMEDNGKRPHKTWGQRVVEKFHLDELRKQGLVSERNETNVAESEITDTLLTEEEQIIVLLKDIRGIIDEKLKGFSEAYKAKDLKTCKSVYAEVEKYFKAITIEHKIVKGISNRLVQAKECLERLETKLQEDAAQKRDLSFSIQKIFNEKYIEFIRSYSLGNKENCLQIYNQLHYTIGISTINLPFINKLCKKLDMMEELLTQLFRKGNDADISMKMAV